MPQPHASASIKAALRQLAYLQTLAPAPLHDTMLHLLARHCQWRVRQCLGMAPNLPAGLLETLSHDEHPMVRLAVAENPRTPPEVLRGLIQRHPHDALLTRAALGNPGLPPDQREPLLAGLAPARRTALALGGRVAEAARQVLHRLGGFAEDSLTQPKWLSVGSTLTDPFPALEPERVRAELERYQNCPPPSLHRAVEDGIVLFDGTPVRFGDGSLLRFADGGRVRWAGWGRVVRRLATDYESHLELTYQPRDPEAWQAALLGRAELQTPLEELTERKAEPLLRSAVADLEAAAGRLEPGFLRLILDLGEEADPSAALRDDPQTVPSIRHPIEHWASLYLLYREDAGQLRGEFANARGLVHLVLCEFSPASWGEYFQGARLLRDELLRLGLGRAGWRYLYRHAHQLPHPPRLFEKGEARWEWNADGCGEWIGRVRLLAELGWPGDQKLVAGLLDIHSVLHLGNDFGMLKALLRGFLGRWGTRLGDRELWEAEFDLVIHWARDHDFDDKNQRNASWGRWLGLARAWRERQTLERLKGAPTQTWKPLLGNHQQGEWEAVELTSGLALLEEGFEMCHCLGCEEFIRAGVEGTSAYFSLRRGGERAATLQADIAEGGWRMGQLKGRHNQQASREAEAFALEVVGRLGQGGEDALLRHHKIAL